MTAIRSLVRFGATYAARSLPRLGVVLLALLVAATGFNPPAAAQTTSGAAAGTIRLEAPAQVRQGELIKLHLSAAGGVEIGALEGLLLFDTAAAEFAGYYPPAPAAGSGLGSLMMPSAPGGSAFGFYTCTFDDCLESGKALAQVAAAASHLAEIDLIPLTPGRLEVKLGHLQVVDAAGRPLQVTVEPAAVVIQVGESEQGLAAPAATLDVDNRKVAAAAVQAADADLAQDGKVGYPDVMEAVLGWQNVWQDGGLCSGREAQADVNRDGCVDIADVQLVAAFASGKGPAVPQPSLPNHLFLPHLPSAGGLVVQSAAPLTFVVNSDQDAWDQRAGDGICRTAAGVCTLRAAVVEANAHPGPDNIVFNIPGTGPFVINLFDHMTSLWDISGGTTIDGYTQPGAAANTDPFVSNARIQIQLRGQGFNAFNGIAITSSDNVIRGLSFFNVRSPIWINGTRATDNVISGNFLGTDAAGTWGYTSGTDSEAQGVHIEGQAKRNLVGGTALADRNIISGNGKQGVGMWHWGTNDNIVYNNIIGLSPDGQRRLRNWRHGVDMNLNAANNIVGGLEPGQRNVISGNVGKGVEISHGQYTANNQVIGNYIGTDVTGNAVAAYTANEMQGVTIKDLARNNLIAGNVIAGNADGGIRVDNYGTCCPTGNIIRDNRIGIGSQGAQLGNADYGVLLTAPDSTIGPGNIIAYNPVGIKVEVADSDRNTITRNSIFGNTGLGIDLGPAGAVNLNDAGDGDTGPNEQLNFPVLMSATPTQVTGTACLTCTVEVFLADGGAGAYGEGRTFLGSAPVAGDGTFAVSISGAADGDYVTATATDATGNTSEFSLNRQVSSAPPQPWDQIWTIPGRIEAENYRSGGQNVAYKDSSTGNAGGVYRSDDVDIQVTLDSSGNYNVGWITGWEWLTYDVNITTGGTYLFTARVANTQADRTFHMELDGVDITGLITVPNTGGTQRWADVSTTVTLPAGLHTLRFYANVGAYNVNYFTFTLQ